MLSSQLSVLLKLINTINNFSNYVDLFLGPKIGGLPRVFERVSDRWEVAIAPSALSAAKALSVEKTDA